MALKTYVLLPVLDADAPIYQTTQDGQRVQLKKIPTWRPYLRISFQDEKGIGRVLRYKSNAFDGEVPVLDQRIQIDKLKLDANEPFTRNEMRHLEFKNGVCFTNSLMSQAYLEAYPGFEGFKGTCDDIREAQYKLLDQAAEATIKNDDIRKRVKAANKVVDLELEEAQKLLIRLNGSFFETPITAAECQNLLMEFIDDAEEGGLDAVLQDEENTTIDDKTTVLIGLLLAAEILSFDAIQGKISKKDKDGKWITVRDMSDEYSLEERKRLFSDFLNTEDGKTLKQDLEKDLKATNKKAKTDK